MTDADKNAFLDGLHGLLKLVFEPLLCLCSSIIQTFYVFFNRSAGPPRFPPWLDPDRPSPSSDDRVSTPTKPSDPPRGSTRQIFLSTLSRQLATKSNRWLAWKEHRRQIEER